MTPALVMLLSFVLLVSACTPPASTTTVSEPLPVVPNAASADDGLFPLTITDAAGQEFTFDAPPRIGCWWAGCTEILADLGLVAHAAGYDEETAKSIFAYPHGLPPQQIADTQNPELWAAAEVDIVIMRVPLAPEHEAYNLATPVFYLHHPSYGESDQSGYDAFIENLRIVGQLTGQPDAAEAAITRFTTALETLRTFSTPAIAAQTVAVLFQGDGYRMIGPGNPFCVALAEAALGNCIGEGAASYEVNAEEFLNLDPDWIVYQTGDTSYQDRTDPIWAELSAVKAGQVFDATNNRYYCCSTRGLILALQDYANHVLPAGTVPATGPQGEFDPTQSPLVQPAADSTATATDAATSACEPGFRLFDHEYLATDPVCIPENPQRIIAVDAYSLETVLAFGVKPIASSSVKPFAVNYPELADRVAGVIDTGGPFNVETGLTTDADLIIAIEPWVGEIYDQASAIAPVVSIDFDEIMWDGFVDLIGQVLNRPAQIEPLIVGYENRVERLRTTIAAQSRQGTISVVQFYNEALRLYFIEDLFPYLFPVSGLSALPEQTAALNGEWRIEVSKEELELLNTDYIFLVTYATNDEEIAANQAMVERLNADPLWQQLAAVGKEQVFVVPFYWNAGAVIGQHKMLDDLFQYVAQVDPATVAPNPFAPAGETAGGS